MDVFQHKCNLYYTKYITHTPRVTWTWPGNCLIGAPNEAVIDGVLVLDAMTRGGTVAPRALVAEKPLAEKRAREKTRDASDRDQLFVVLPSMSLAALGYCLQASHR